MESVLSFFLCIRRLGSCLNLFLLLATLLMPPWEGLGEDGLVVLAADTVQHLEGRGVSCSHVSLQHYA